MVTGHAIRAHVETASSDKVIVAVNPNREVLFGLRALQVDVNAFDGSGPAEMCCKGESVDTP